VKARTASLFGGDKNLANIVKTFLKLTLFADFLKIKILTNVQPNKL